MNQLVSKIWKKLFSRVRSYAIALGDLMPWAEKNFAWKTRWRMRKDRNPTFVIVQDKYKVKQYAQERGVKTAETYYVTNNPDDIPFETLPDRYFLKVNHGCGWNILFKNGEFYLYKPTINVSQTEGFSERKITRDEAKEYCKKWLKEKYSTKQWAYSQIEPLVLVEEVLMPFEDDELKDYKFYVFDGVAKAIIVLSASIRRKHENIILDADWKMFDLNEVEYAHPDTPPECPSNFSEMLEVAERLGKGFDFARVDLYNTTKGIVLGEMTMYPLGGRPSCPSYDKKFNKWLGDQWTLPRLR